MDYAEHTISRRAFLSGGARGLSALALATLVDPSLALAAKTGDRWRGVVDPLHFAPRAKRVIWLYMAGGPSQLESFDSKPKLGELDGQPMPKSFTEGQPIAQLQGFPQLFCMGPQYPFSRYGESGQEISSLFPHIGGVADDICIIRSMQTEQINHDPAHTYMNTRAPCFELRLHGFPA